MAEMDGPAKESKTLALDAAVHNIGFVIDEVTPEKVNGRLKVTEKCCQPFKVMHGGVSALIAESLASIGAHLASGLQGVAGIQLNVNHIKSAKLGELIFAEAVPISKNTRLQVWMVQIWKMDPSTLQKGKLVSSSTVTVLADLHVSKTTLDSASAGLKKYAKL